MKSSKILAASLAFLTTRELIAVVPVCRRFYSLIVRLLHRRLIDASSLPNNQLILECYHPSEKISTPYLSCRHLGQKLVKGSNAQQSSTTTRPARAHGMSRGELNTCNDGLKLGDLSNMYSSFRPVVLEENRRIRKFKNLPRPPADASDDGQGDGDVATQQVYLDDGELFSQLCTVTNVVKETTRRGFFVSHINTCDGVLRIWRHWLAEQAGLSGPADANADSGMSAEDAVRKGKGGDYVDYVDFDKYLWVGPTKNVGLRFRVVPGPAETMPLISGPGDEAPVSYTLIYEGKVCVVPLLASSFLDAHDYYHSENM